MPVRMTWSLVLHSPIHVKSPSLGGRLPLFDLISLLNIHLPPTMGKLPLFGPHLLLIIFPLKRVNSIEFSNELYATKKREYVPMLKNSAWIWMFQDKINALERFHVKSPSLARCKEGDPPLLKFSNLTCMLTTDELFGPRVLFQSSSDPLT